MLVLDEDRVECKRETEITDLKPENQLPLQVLPCSLNISLSLSRSLALQLYVRVLNVLWGVSQVRSDSQKPAQSP